MTVFVLVHSPVTGPSTWRWVAAELTARGHEVLVPAVPAVRVWQEFADSVAAQAGQQHDAVLAGHSGAGPLLPQIAARVGSRRLVFVDAGIPPDQGEAELMPAEILAELRKLAVDGLLPPWSEWFGSDVMRDLVPDAERRAAITAELPRVPLAYFEARVPVPTGWAAACCGYVLLSEAYATAADAAEARGWPVLRRQGGHLDLVTIPDVIAADIVSV
ncbi:MAG: alpha/beta hydrolase [Actinobacteria bacterium]|nr:alpha/beta hydrolase [Actinomycetota bacterium]